MTTLIVATRNAHKTGEIRAILGERLRVLCLKDFPSAPNAVEDADTFAGNAAKKANTVANWLHATAPEELRGENSFVLADDSGLEVDALNGAPGVHSARFAALDSGAPGNSSDAENNAKLLRLLKDIPRERRTARFRCVLALVEISPSSAGRPPQFFEGACEGHIEFAPSGGGGFGYDPLFVPDGFTQSFAELGDDVKNRLSHRARALEKLRGGFQAE
jgi:XTP/dITP diphosphohydrolase